MRYNYDQIKQTLDSFSDNSRFISQIRTREQININSLLAWFNVTLNFNANIPKILKWNFFDEG